MRLVPRSLRQPRRDPDPRPLRRRRPRPDRHPHRAATTSPGTSTRASAIAFLRDYGIPSIARLLDRTGEFEDHGIKRYDDTLVFQEEAVADGVDSDAVPRRAPPAEPDPRPLRHPQRRVPVRAGHHARRPGALDRALRLAPPRPGRAGRAHPVHHPVRRADGDQGTARDLRRLPRAAHLLRARAVRARPGQHAGHRGDDPDRPGDRAVVPQARLPPGHDRADGRAAAPGARHGARSRAGWSRRSTWGCGCARGLLRFAPPRASAVRAHAPDVPRRLPARARSARRRCSTSSTAGPARRSAPLPDRPSIYEQEHEDFRATARAFLEREVVPHHEQWEQDGQVEPRGLAQGRRGGAALLRRRRGVRRRRGQGLPLQRGAHRGDHPGRRQRARLPGPQRRDRPLHQPPGDRRAEAALAARPGQRRADLGDRDDRARRRVGPPGHPDHARSTRATTTSSTAPRRSSATASCPTW